MVNQQQLNELEVLAKRAGSAKWRNYGSLVGIEDTYQIAGGIPEPVCDAFGVEYAAFIAAASPAIMLELLSEIKSLRRENIRLNAEADWLANNTGSDCPDEVDPEVYEDIYKRGNAEAGKRIRALWRRAAKMILDGSKTCISKFLIRVAGRE